MASMEAILRIRAEATGQAGVRELDALIRRLGPGAESSVAGILRMNGALRNIGTVAAGIGLANIGSQLVQFGKSSVQSGDDSLLAARRIENLSGALGESGRVMEFARSSADRFTLAQNDASTAVADLYGRLRPMNVSLGDIQSTFNGLSITARNAGLSMLDTKEAARQLGQALGSGRLQGDEFRSLMERMPQIGTAIVKVFNDIAKEKGLVQITRERADAMVAEIKEGEKKMTKTMETQTKEREKIAEGETNAILREIQKRYDAEKKRLDRKNEDEDDARAKARDKRMEKDQQGITQLTEAERAEIEKRYDAQAKAFDREYEDRLDLLNKTKGLSDEERKSIERRIEDERDRFMEYQNQRKEAEIKAINDRKDNQLKALQETREAEDKEIARANEDRRNAEKASLEESQRIEEEAQKNLLDKKKQELKDSLAAEVEENKKANQQTIADILARVKVTRGELKRMSSEGLITPEVMIRAMKELEKVNLTPATPLMEFNRAMGDLAKTVGEVLLPVLTPLIQGLDSTVKWFGTLPGPVKAATIAVVGLGAAFAGLNILGLGGGLAGFISSLSKVPATIAGWLGLVGPAIRLLASVGTAIGPIISGITAAFTGLFTWFASVAVPTLVGFFSGPAGWITLAVAAIVAGVIFFREPIMEFFEWVGKGIGQIAGTIVKGIDEKIIKPVVGMFSGIWREIGTPVTNALKNISWLIMEAAKGYYGLLYQFTLKPFVDGIIGLWSLIEQPLTQLWEGFKTKAAEAFAFLAPALQVAWDSMLLSAQAFLTPYSLIWESIKKPATDFASYLGTFLDEKWEAILTYASENFIEPWNEFWKGIAKTIADTAKAMEVGIGNIWKKIIDFANKTFIKPWEEFWDLITSKPEEFKKTVTGIGESLQKDFLTWFKSLPTLIGKAWDEALYKISRVTSYLNREAVLALNNLLRGYNALAAVSKGFLPTFKELPVPAEVPLLAKGAYLDRPTLAMVAEAGQPEYAIPASAMPAAVEGWQRGLRGDALARAWQSPGSLSPGSSLPGAGAPVGTGGGAMAAGGGGAVVGRAALNLTIKTGPVIQQPDGSRWVSLDELPAIAEAIHRSAVAGAVDATMALQGSAAMRSVQGWS